MPIGMDIETQRRIKFNELGRRWALLQQQYVMQGFTPEQAASRAATDLGASPENASQVALLHTPDPNGHSGWTSIFSQIAPVAIGAIIAGTVAAPYLAGAGAGGAGVSSYSPYAVGEPLAGFAPGVTGAAETTSLAAPTAAAATTAGAAGTGGGMGMGEWAAINGLVGLGSSYLSGQSAQNAANAANAANIDMFNKQLDYKRWSDQENARHQVWLDQFGQASALDAWQKAVFDANMQRSNLLGRLGAPGQAVALPEMSGSPATQNITPFTPSTYPGYQPQSGTMTVGKFAASALNKV